jgi:glycine cleavage system H protein
VLDTVAARPGRERDAGLGQNRAEAGMGEDTMAGDGVYPEDLRYSREHEWIRLDGTTIRIGITSYAQEALGDIVYVSLPELGAEVRSGEPFGEIESTKSVSDVYTPASGEVKARNETLDGSPELVNSDPYGDGWLIDVTVADPSVLDDLLDAAGYREFVQSG